MNVVVGFFAVVALWAAALLVAAGLYDLVWSVTDLDALTGIDPTYLNWLGGLVVLAGVGAILRGGSNES